MLRTGNEVLRMNFICGEAAFPDSRTLAVAELSESNENGPGEGISAIKMPMTDANSSKAQMSLHDALSVLIRIFLRKLRGIWLMFARKHSTTPDPMPVLSQIIPPMLFVEASQAMMPRDGAIDATNRSQWEKWPMTVRCIFNCEQLSR